MVDQVLITTNVEGQKFVKLRVSPLQAARTVIPRTYVGARVHR